MCAAHRAAAHCRCPNLHLQKLQTRGSRLRDRSGEGPEVNLAAQACQSGTELKERLSYKLLLIGHG